MRTGQLLLTMILTFGFIAAYPFAKAGLLHGATTVLKFQERSYRKALFCVLIGIGTMTAVYMILLGLTMRRGLLLDQTAILRTCLLTLFLSLFLTPISEAISLHFYYKESPGKTLAAIALHYLFFILLAIALALLYFIVAIAVNLITG